MERNGKMSNVNYFNGYTKFAQGTKTKWGLRTAVTMPEELFYEIKARAVESERSISKQIVHMVRTYIEMNDER